MNVNLPQFIALGVVLLPVGAMFIDMAFHQRLLKKLRKEAVKKARNNQ